MASTVASLFTALLPHQGQRHTDWSDGTSSPEYKIKNGLLWWQTAWTVPPSGCGSHDTRLGLLSALSLSGNGNTRLNKSQCTKKDLHSVLVVFLFFCFFPQPPKKRERKPPTEYILYGTVHGPCLDMQIRLVYDCLATMLFHLLPLEGCLPHAWSGAKRLHGNHDNGGTWGRGWLEGRFFFGRTITLRRTGTGP